MGLRPTRYACGTRGSRWSWADCLGILINAGELLAFPQSALEQERFVEGVWIGCPWSSLGRPDFGKDRGGLVPCRHVCSLGRGLRSVRRQVVFLIFTAVAVILGVRKFFPKTGSGLTSDRN